MSPRWSDTMAVGIGEIDSQHRELFNRINALVAAMKEARGVDEVDKTLEFLSEYVIDHFGMEEKLMDSRNFPEAQAEAHKTEHEDFKKKFQEFKDKLDAEGPSSALSLKTSNLLGTWWIDHISQVDKKLGAFLKDRT